jgi:hypothetical protein
MRVRSGVAIASIVVLELFGAACAGAARPAEPSRPSPSPGLTVEPRTTAEPSEPPSTPALTPTPAAPGANWLRVTPQQGAPGSTVSLDLACLDNVGAVHSPVLDIGALKGNPEGHQPWRLFGTATVRSNAASGQYQISTTCGANEVSTDFIVIAPPTR